MREQQLNEETIQAVLAVERAWTQAHLAGDRTTIERLMAEDYIKIEPGG